MRDPPINLNESTDSTTNVETLFFALNTLNYIYRIYPLLSDTMAWKGPFKKGIDCFRTSQLETSLEFFNQVNCFCHCVCVCDARFD